MNKNPYTLIGAAVLFSSLATVVDYSIRKKRTQVSHTAELIAGVAGLVLGACLVAEPTQQALRWRKPISSMTKALPKQNSRSKRN